ncbi:MAG: peptidylprolyl isomerase [Thermodesulfovibrionales bacterium]
MTIKRQTLSLVLSAFLLLSFSTEASTVPFLLDRVVAVVDKEVITWSELYRAMEFESGLDFRNVSEADKKRFFKENEAKFLETLIDRRLQLQEAKKLDISASNEEVKEAIEGIKKKYNLSDKDFEESLKAEGMTPEEYRKRLSEQIILSKVVNQQVRSKIIVTEEEINNYISKNRGSSYRVRQILIKKTKDRDRDSMMAKAREAIVRIKAGEDFSAVAFSISEDPSAKAGGDLGIIKKELLSKEFLDVLSRMNVGDVSEPFWTDKGLHIIKLDEKIEANSPEEMREMARKKLFENKFNEAYRGWIRSLREKAFIEVRL